MKVTKVLFFLAVISVFSICFAGDEAQTKISTHDCDRLKTEHRGPTKAYLSSKTLGGATPKADELLPLESTYKWEDLFTRTSDPRVAVRIRQSDSVSFNVRVQLMQESGHYIAEIVGDEVPTDAEVQTALDAMRKAKTTASEARKPKWVKVMVNSADDPPGGQDYKDSHADQLMPPDGNNPFCPGHPLERWNHLFSHHDQDGKERQFGVKHGARRIPTKASWRNQNKERAAEVK